VPLVPREKIDDVRERTNIVDIVKRHVELKRAGTGSWKGLCPFHGEKTPSFHVHEPRQFFHCFGCGEKGDVITFLVKIEQRPFMDVLTDLAGAAGVDLDVRPLTPAERRARQEQESERDRMFRALELAAAFFEEQYASPAGAAARAYVEGRGIGAEVRQKFRVGYAPARWDALSSHLGAHKIPHAVMEQLGLVGVNERGMYDFFRDRVMLPVLDRQRRVVGFGGRLLDPEAKDRKYVNSPESPLFHKKEQLYGLHAALDAIRKTGRAVVVEGNFDVLALHQAGIEEALAPMGTALTPEQLNVLASLAKRIVLMFDGDGAGVRAAKKALLSLAELPKDDVITNLAIGRLPRGVDPDEFVRAEGVEAFRRVEESARPFLLHLIHEAAEDPSIPGRMESLERIAELLVKLRNPTARELYAAEAGTVLKLTPQQVTRALREASGKAQRAIPATSQVTASAASPPAPLVRSAEPPRFPKEEEETVLVLARYPELLRTPEAVRAGELLVHPTLRQLYRLAVEQVTVNGTFEVVSWLDAASPEVGAYMSAALMSEHLAEIADPPKFLRKLAIRLELLRVEAEIAMNARLQREALTRGDDQAAHALTKRGIDLQQTRKGLQAALQGP
jgi:DNA primase